MRATGCKCGSLLCVLMDVGFAELASTTYARGKAWREAGERVRRAAINVRNSPKDYSYFFQVYSVQLKLEYSISFG